LQQRIAAHEVELETLLGDSERGDLRLLIRYRPALGAHERKAASEHDREQRYDENRKWDREPATSGIIQHMINGLG
jgi:hypothetical protein